MNSNKQEADESVLTVRIQPNASKNEVVGMVDGILKIKIKAPPVDGKANKECLTFLAKVLQIPKSHLSIIKGEKTRSKVIQVVGMNQDVCRKRITSGF